MAAICIMASCYLNLYLALGLLFIFCIGVFGEDEKTEE